MIGFYLVKVHHLCSFFILHITSPTVAPIITVITLNLLFFGLLWNILSHMIKL